MPFLLNAPDLVGSWVAKRTGGDWQRGRGQAFGVVSRSNELVAGVTFDSWNGASLCMHVAAVSGVRWATRDFLRICFYYPFKQLQCHKVLGLVGSGNIAARRFDEHLGFELEATLKGAHPDGDLLVYSMTAEKCRWLTTSKERNCEQTQGTPAA